MASRPIKSLSIEQSARQLRYQVRTFVQVRQRRAERQANEMVARRTEQIPAMRRIDIEENARNDDGLFLQQLFKEGLENE